MAYTAQEWSEWQLVMLQAGFKQTAGGSMYGRWDTDAQKKGAVNHRQHVVLYDGQGGYWKALYRDWASPPIYGAPAALAYAELHNWGE